MWRRVELGWTDVSEERIASIFMVEKSASKEPAWSGNRRLTPPPDKKKTVVNLYSLQPPAHVGSSQADFSTLMTETYVPMLAWLAGKPKVIHK
jgi:hypothetical protein